MGVESRRRWKVTRVDSLGGGPSKDLPPRSPVRKVGGGGEGQGDPSVGSPGRHGREPRGGRTRQPRCRTGGEVTWQDWGHPDPS